MRLLESKRFKLPTIFYVTDRAEIKEIPVGIPYIYGDEQSEKDIVRLLEYEILYESAMRLGYPFDFKKILRDNGYKTNSFDFSNPSYIEYTSDGDITRKNISTSTETTEVVSTDHRLFRDFVTDTAAYVDISKLKSLKVFPMWLDQIEEAISVNINSFAVFNPNMYNKKLGGMYGTMTMTSPPKNLIIIDISGSIPKAVSSTCLAMAKNLSETFYADLIITGSKSTLYNYEDIPGLDIQNMYEENGMGNEQIYFRRLLTGEERSYDTAIVFGDNHQPGHSWRVCGEERSVTISEEDGRKECKWNVKKVVSLHTHSTKDDPRIAGYGVWFSPDEVEHIHDWVEYLSNVS